MMYQGISNSYLKIQLSNNVHDYNHNDRWLEDILPIHANYWNGDTTH